MKDDASENQSDSNQYLSNNLPSYAELTGDDTDVLFKYNKLLELLNKPTPASWIKNHPTISNHRYLPIDKIESLLYRIFGLKWRREILREGVMFNSVYTTVRLHYCVPKTDLWLFHDGTGAVGVQTKKGESAANLSEIKTDAVQKALPASASYALGNAAEKLGKIFGTDLNRSDAMPYMGVIDIDAVDDNLNGKPAPPPAQTVNLSKTTVEHQNGNEINADNFEIIY